MHSRGKRRSGSLFWGWLFFIAVGGMLLSGCGGGGGLDDDDDELFRGGGGTGADNTIIFWRYYGTLDADEVGEHLAVDVASDGGYVAAGWIAPDFIWENRNYILLKTDEQGLEQWRLQGNLPGAQALHAIRETSDGGVIAAGAWGSGENQAALVIKTDQNGRLKWREAFPRGEARAVEVISDTLGSEEYAISGTALRNVSHGDVPHLQWDMWFFRLDGQGKKIENSDRFVSLNGNSFANAMERTHDGGFVLTGGGPHNAILVARFDENGDHVWSRRDYGTGVAHGIRQLPDDGFVVVGSTTFFPEKASDLFVLRTDGEGNELWRRVFGGSELDIGYGVALTEEGDIVVVGVTQSFSSGTQGWHREDFYLIKLTPEGQTLWQKVKGMRPQNSEKPAAIEATPDGGFIVAGAASAVNLLAKFDKNGDTVRLGEKDLTYTVPEQTGLIHMGNALEIARMAGASVMMPFQIGSFTVDRLIDTLNGVEPGDFCSSGGFSWDPEIFDPVAEGQVFTLAFAVCEVGSGEEANTFDGTIRMTVGPVHDDLKTNDYRISVTLDEIDIAIIDSVGSGRVVGGMNFDRKSTGGTFAERVLVSEELQLIDDGGTLTISRIDVTADRTAEGVLTIGVAGETGLIDADLNSGTFTITIVEPLILENLPTAGTLSVEAEDDSNLIMEFYQGDVKIAVDTNGDGIADGTTWMEWD